MLKLYNTETRTVEEFKPIKEGEVKLYACGPTVYNYAHIGNLRTYVFEDLLKRWLLYKGYKVKHVMNITDVGHLTSDEDEGEDKIEKGAKREGKTVWDIADFYTKAFQEDIKKLNILEPDIWCKATDHIQEIIDLIKKLEKNGLTYFKEGNVYFDTTKFPDYGKMANLKLDELKAGARICIDDNKKNPRDFVVWFTNSKFKQHTMLWGSPWGKGYPGWHIECSAMSMKYLGDQMDIHCGGIDHIPVHHTNEIAQSEGATGKKWVNWWVHGAWLVVEAGEKMAKSTGKFLSLDTVLKDGNISTGAVRYYLMSAHYRQELKFKWDALTSAQTTVNNLNNFIQSILGIDNNGKLNKEIKEFSDLCLKGFEESMDNDLNLPLAMPFVFEMITKIKPIKENNQLTKKDVEYILQILKKINKIITVLNFEKQEIPKEVKKMTEERQKAREVKDWNKSDKLRDKIKEKGFIVEDKASGWELKKL